jgi:large subunit ribosomal protein L3
MLRKSIIGRKVGMSQIFDEEGKAVPVTVIEAGPCYVVQKKTPERDGYAALQIGFKDVSGDRLNSPMRGHFEKDKVKPLRFLKEMRLDETELDNYNVGDEIKVDIFNSGESVDVQGISKGKGFAGSIKRHGTRRGPKTHGSRYHRGPGSLGAVAAARVFKGRKLPGRMGGERVTVQNLQVVKVDSDRNLIMVRGAVPGPRKGLLIIKDSLH